MTTTTSPREQPREADSGDLTTQYLFPATGEELTAIVAYWVRVIFDPRFCGIPDTTSRRLAEERLAIVAAELGMDHMWEAMDNAWINYLLDLDTARDAEVCQVIESALRDHGTSTPEWGACYREFLRQIYEGYADSSRQG